MDEELVREGIKRDGAPPRVAVIVPIYQNAETVKRCAQSILSQTYGELELWLIDDGSTDGGGALCDAIAAKDARVHVVHKENEGLVRTWMRGVRESSAPYLCFVDGDDWIEETLLERLVGALDERAEDEGDAPPEVVCGGYCIDREDGKVPERKKCGAAPGVYEGERLYREIRARILGNEERTVILSRCMKLFSRSLLEENLRYCDPALRMGEDVSIVLPALLDASRVTILADSQEYHYVYKRDSMVHAYDPTLCAQVRRLREVIARVLEEKEVEGARQMERREYLLLLLLVLKNELRGKEKGGTARIQALCREENTRDLLNECDFRPKETANRLLVWLMRRPTAARILAARVIFRAYDKVGRIF